MWKVSLLLVRVAKFRVCLHVCRGRGSVFRDISGIRAVNTPGDWLKLGLVS